MAENIDDFEARLSALVAMELSEARRDSDRMGVLIERLSAALGLVIATAAKGKSEGIDELVAGAEGYIHSTAVEKAPLARFLDGARGQRLPPELWDDG